MSVKMKNKDYYDSTKDTGDVIVKKLYLINSAVTAQENINEIYSIFNSISSQLSVPFRHIYTVGSAHTGFSLKDGHLFCPGDSDLDVAIVDQHLFNKYMVSILEETHYYQNLENFKIKDVSINGNTRKCNDFISYKENLAKGIIHPRYFPTGETKANWDKYFFNITKPYTGIFKKITACIFLSEDSFRMKQEADIKYFKSQKVTER